MRQNWPREPLEIELRDRFPRVPANPNTRFAVTNSDYETKIPAAFDTPVGVSALIGIGWTIFLMKTGESKLIFSLGPRGNSLDMPLQK